MQRLGLQKDVKKATELERKARANRTGNRLAVGGGCKTAGHFISGAGYRSQWPRYATGDLGPMRGKLFLLACRQVVEANCNYAPREADPQRQRKLPASSRRVKQLQRCSVTRALRQPRKGGRTSHTRLRRWGRRCEPH